MANGDDVREVWAEMNRLKDRQQENELRTQASISNTEKIAQRIEDAITYHIQEKTIHHTPPCYSLKALTAKLWAIAAAVIGLVIHQVVTKLG